MKSNYNDIIDMILTFVEDEDILDNIVIGGSVVPYVIKKEEPNYLLKSFYILVKADKCNLVRSRIKRLSKEFLFDITTDSTELSGFDYGFKIKYEDTIVGFFPYESDENDILIKTYCVEKNKKIKLKDKLIPNLNERLLIRKALLDDTKNIYLISPEFIFAEQELNENVLGNELNIDLKKICDAQVVDHLKEILSKSEIKIISYDIEQRHNYYYVILLILFIIIIYLLYLVLS